MMKNITTTTNTINKNTPSLRERTHELAKAQKKAILECIVHSTTVQ